MASGKPPRRAKTSNEPVTIDLESTAVKPEMPDEGLKPDELTADENVTVSPEGEPVDAADVKQSEPASDPAGIPLDEQLPPDDGTRPEDLTSDESFDPAPDNSTVPTPPTNTPAARSTGPGVGTLIGSGLVGGIIALLCAGGLQYAGYLPAASSSAQMTSETTEANSELQSKISSLEAKVAALSENASSAGTADGELAARLQSLETKVTDLGSTDAANEQQKALDELKSQVATLSTTLNEAQSAISANKEALSNADTRLATAEQKLDNPSKDIEVARTIALNSLKSAVERGGPYLSELDTVKSIAPDDPSIAGLQEHAASGVASRAELVRQFPDVANRILTAVNQPEGSDGISGRLMASAMSLIKVRPVGNVEGDGPEAIVARMEDKLRNGDIKGAELEWQSLPDAGKQVSQDFDDKLKVRIDVESKVDAALNTTLGANG